MKPFDPEAFNLLSADEKRAQFKTMPKENMRLYLDYKRILAEQQYRWKPETWADKSKKDLQRIPLDGQIYQCRIGEKTFESRGFWSIHELKLGHVRLEKWSRTQAQSLQTKFNRASINKQNYFVLEDGTTASVMRIR